MANSTGSNIRTALTVGAIVFGIVTGSLGISATIGPGQRVAAMEARVAKADQTREEFIDFRSSVAADITTIKNTLVEIKGKLP